MITSHVWRPIKSGGPTQRWITAIPIADRPCAFANCGKPRSEHERAASGRYWQ